MAMMPAAVADEVGRERAEALPTRDKITIGLVAFFSLVALSLELYYILFNQVLEQRSDIFVKLLSLYWPADYTYRIPGYPIEKCFTLSLETVNTLITQPLSAVLVYGIVKRKPWRHVLQLTLATYTFYGTFLYYYVAHLSGYKAFADHSVNTFLMFYLANLPWFIAYAWMGYDSFRVIAKRFGRP